MITRSAMVLSGAVGILFAALIYLLATRLAGALGPLVPIRQAQWVVFAILFAVSFLEMPVMLFGLRRLRASKMRRVLFCSANTMYVAFGGVYAAVQVLLFGESNLTAVLAGLSLVRWITGSWMI